MPNALSPVLQTPMSALKRLSAKSKPQRQQERNLQSNQHSEGRDEGEKKKTAFMYTSIYFLSFCGI